ncbi:MAG: flavodoxin family protein [Clostridia bacterium]|nr:flavodoxin family protein [Clostridia bacterium]
MKKALVIFGSPRQNGDTAFLTNLFVQNFDGQVTTLDVFGNPKTGTKQITPCLDCRGCEKVEGCVIQDGLMQTLKGNYDVVVIASPIFMSNLPAPMMALVTRLNFLYNNKKHLKKQTAFCDKKAVLILVGGGGACKMLMGETNQDNAIKQAQYIFKKIGATLSDDNVVMSLKTDEIPVLQDAQAQNKIINIAKSF